MLHTVSSRQIQRGYKKIFEDANMHGDPVLVLSNSKPQGAIIGLALLEKIRLGERLKKALSERNQGRAKKISTEDELEADLKALESYV